jgi:ribosomal-protein-alanine N-acetyltransferase
MARVRRGEPQDSEVVLEIQRRAIAEPVPLLLSAALSGPPPLFVADDRGPVGYAVVVPGGEVAYVPELAIHPDRQGEGLGSRLVEHLAAAFDGHRELRVTVRRIDDRARRFYESLGFDRHGRVAEQFEDCDGLVMARPLGAP